MSGDKNKMKIIDKVTIVKKQIDGEVSMNGSNPIEHSTEQVQMFISSSDANDFVNTQSDLDIEEVIREDFFDNMYEICVDAEVSDTEVTECKFEDLNTYDTIMLLRKYPNHEIKTMFYEIDGVKSSTKVLVLKPFDEKIAVSKLEVA